MGIAISVTSLSSPEEAARLPQGSATWPQARVGEQHTLLLDTPEDVTLVKVQVEFTAQYDVWPGFTVSSGLEDLRGNISSIGRMQTWTANAFCGQKRLGKQWKVTPQCDSRSATQYAGLTKIEVMAKKTTKAYAKDVVGKLSKELLILS